MADKTAPSAAASSRSNASVRSRAFGQIPATLEALNSLDTVRRKDALTEAAQSFEEGKIVRPLGTGWINVLARTFFSYSADGFSPSRLAWEAVIRGVSVIGCADRNNLGALGEMLSAGDILKIRTTVSMEAKTLVTGYSDKVLNCPGQPGLLRALGVGFTQVPPLESEHGRLIASLPEYAAERNAAMIEKVNAALSPVTINLAEDVLPLTPAGNATFEHIAQAYSKKATDIFPEKPDLVVFWADVLGKSPPDVEALLTNVPTFLETIFGKIQQLGAVKTETDAAHYPPVTTFFQAVRDSGAIPCIFWGGGESPGEADPDRLLDDAVNWGARAVALHPDRNWNISDPECKQGKQAAMAAFIQAARDRGLPILAGSPLDAPRQKFVDSFDAPEISSYFRDFTDSAFWLYGHTVMERAAGLGLTSEWAHHTFHRDFTSANAFYIKVGKKAIPGKETRRRIADLCPDADPRDILDALTP